jgi:hypothetical protein
VTDNDRYFKIFFDMYGICKFASLLPIKVYRNGFFFFKLTNRIRYIFLDRVNFLLIFSIESVLVDFRKNRKFSAKLDFTSRKVKLLSHHLVSIIDNSVSLIKYTI